MPQTTMLDKIGFGTHFKLTQHSPYAYTIVRRGKNEKDGRDIFLIERVRTGFQKWVFNKRVY